MTETRLFFGRDIKGGGVVDDAAWGDFAARVLTPAFPDGFTVYAAVGQWRNPSKGKIVREPTEVVQIDGAVLPQAIAEVTAVYRQEFHQISVGVETAPVCAAF
jgi:hypothetical protein